MTGWSLLASLGQFCQTKRSSSEPTTRFSTIRPRPRKSQLSKPTPKGLMATLLMSKGRVSSTRSTRQLRFNLIWSKSGLPQAKLTNSRCSTSPSSTCPFRSQSARLSSLKSRLRCRSSGTTNARRGFSQAQQATSPCSPRPRSSSKTNQLSSFRSSILCPRRATMSTKATRSSSDFYSSRTQAVFRRRQSSKSTSTRRTR